jgi:hypothetical protein
MIRKAPKNGNWPVFFINYGLWPPERIIGHFFTEMATNYLNQDNLSQTEMSEIWQTNRSAIFSSMSSIRSDSAKKIKELAIAKWKGKIPANVFETKTWHSFLEKCGVPINSLAEFQRIVSFVWLVVR